MEGNITKLFEGEFQENFLHTGNLTESDLDSPDKIFRDEANLKVRLDDLKHKNFMLQASIKAWQTTLRKKLEEFKNADSKLDEIYNDIWSEREKFCSEADKFNDSCGVFSDWWAAQMKFVSDLEKLEEKTSEDEKRRRKIEELEREVEKLKEKVKDLKLRNKYAEVEVHATAEGDSALSRDEDETEVFSFEKPLEKTWLSEPDKIEACGGGELAGYDLYSFVDLEKVRMANRNKIRRRKNNFFGKVKNLLSKNDC